MIYLGLIFFVFIVILSWMWGQHIEWMQEKHPEQLKKDSDED